MSLASQLQALATRVGEEVKAVRAVAVAKYTKPGAGIPSTDLTAAVQAALTDARTPTSHTHPAAQISDSTALGQSLVKASDAATARTAIGAGTSNLALGTTSTTAAAGDHTHVFPWSTEIVVASPATPRANGYGEGEGGVTCDRAIVLEEVRVRVPVFSVGIQGSGSLTLEIYQDPTGQVAGSLVGAAFTMALGVRTYTYVLPTPVSLPQDTVLRTKMTIGTTTGNGLQVQYRGRYQ